VASSSLKDNYRLLLPEYLLIIWKHLWRVFDAFATTKGMTAGPLTPMVALPPTAAAVSFDYQAKAVKHAPAGGAENRSQPNSHALMSAPSSTTIEYII